MEGDVCGVKESVLKDKTIIKAGKQFLHPLDGAYVYQYTYQTVLPDSHKLDTLEHKEQDGSKLVGYHPHHLTIADVCSVTCNQCFDA